MVFFKVLIRKILNKIPLKFLLLICIALLFSFIIIGSDVHAVEPDLSDYANHVNGNKWAILRSNSDDSYYLGVSQDQSKTLCSANISNNNGLYTCGGDFRTLNRGNSVWGAEGRTDIYKFNTNTNVFDFYVTNSPGNTFFAGTSVLLYSGSTIYGYLSNTGNLSGVNFPSTAYEYIPPSPYIENINDISNWSFDNLIINGGGVNPYYSVIDNNIEYQYFRTFKLEITYEGVVYTTDLRQYATAYDNDYVIFTIPKNELSNHFNVYNGNNIQFDLFVQPDDNPNSTGNWSSYSLGTYTFNLTTEEQDKINNDSDKQLLGNINDNINTTNNNINNLNNTQQQTNNKIDNLTESITSSDFNESEAEGLFANFGQGMVITDNTHLEELFLILYNAFCNNQIINLEFDMPFTNNHVVISSENISFNYPQALVNIVHLFVWGMIGLYIIKDIRTMINKVAEGNIENVSSDVKKEVL